MKKVKFRYSFIRFKKLISFFICLIAIYLNASSQINNSCDSLFNQADKFYNSGNLENAIQVYTQVFQDCQSYHAASALSKSYALSGNLDSAFFYLDIAVKQDTGKNCLKSISMGEYYSLINDKRWKKLKNHQIDKYENTFGKLPKRKLTEILCDLYIKDQAFYYHLSAYPDKSSKYWDIKSKLNEQNLQKVNRMVKKHGWPKNSEVGENMNSAIFLIIQHCGDVDIMREYLPLIEKCVGSGDEKGSHWALLTDRINQTIGEKQVYGTQISYDPDKQIYYLDNIVDFENLNSRRKSLNMQPIEEYLKIWNAEIRSDDDIKDKITNLQIPVIKNFNDSSDIAKAKIYAVMHNLDSAFCYLQKALVNDSTLDILFAGEFFPLLKNPQWDILLFTQIKKYETKYAHVPNKDLTKALCELKIRNWAYRYEIPLQPENKYLYIKLKQKINEENFDTLKNIIITKGWPKDSEIPEEVRNVAFDIMKACPKLDSVRALFPYIEKCIKRGETSKKQYASLIDGISLQMKGKQVYGTIAVIIPSNQSFYRPPIMDEKNLNKRRKEMGLEAVNME